MVTAQKKLHEVSPISSLSEEKHQQGFIQRLCDWINSHFEFPSGELAIVATTGQKISLPTPLLGALVALFIWMAGGTLAGVYLAGRMSATVDNLGNTFTQYQIRAEAESKATKETYELEIKRLTDKNELQDLVISDLREKQIRADARRN